MKQSIPPKWKSAWKQEERRIGNSQGKPFTIHIFQHQQTDLRAEFVGRKTYVQVSLPRLLFKHNGRLITKQRQIDQAMKAADLLLTQIADRRVSIPGTKFVRVDLAWQIKGKIQDFIAAHQPITHPEIHGLPSIWQGESILWKGKEMSILFYDKFAEMRKKRNHLSKIPEKARDIVRIEIRLRGSKLSALLGKGKSVTRLDVTACYSVLRQRICAFCTAPTYRATSKLEICKHAIEEGWKIGNQSAIEVFLTEYSDASRAKMNKRLQKTRLRANKINWMKELPPQMPSSLIVKNGCSFSLPDFP